jgi:hypothetical protein
MDIQLRVILPTCGKTLLSQLLGYYYKYTTTVVLCILVSEILENQI